MTQQNQNLFSLAALVIILIYCFTVYSPSLNSYFIADDHLWRRVVSLKESISFFWSTWGHGLAYRPLVRISFAINAWFSQEPFSWHVVNITIHAINSFLVYLIIIKLGRSQSYINNAIGSWVTVTAFLAAILFASSATSYQNVTWISARTHSLAALFFLLAFYTQLNHSKLSKSLSVFFFIASMMCYESMAIFPFFLLTINFTHNLFNGKNTKEASKIILKQWRFYSILIITLLLFLVYRYYVLDVYTVRVVGFATSLLRPLENLELYLKLVLKFNGLILICSIIILAASIKNKKLRLPTLLLCLCALLILAPYLPADAAAYRYTYLFTLFGVVICCLFLAAGLTNFKGLIGKAILIALSIATTIHNTSTLNTYVHHNAKGAKLAKKILEQSSNLIDKLPEEGQLFFAGIPAYKNDGLVHITYFDYALKKYLGQKKSKSEIFWDFKLKAHPQYLKQIDKNDTFFLFKNSKLLEVDFDTWIKSNEVETIMKNINN